MTSCELEFLTNIASQHGPHLDDETVSLMLEYFFRVHQKRPYLSHALKLDQHISDLISVHKGTRVGLMAFVEETVIPETLQHYTEIKQT